MRDYRLYLADIAKSVEKIQRYTSGMSFEDFVADERTFDAVVRNLEIIGEAVLNIPAALRERYPNVEWQNIGKIRNFLAHGYFKVKESVVWNIASNDVPLLQSQVSHILESESSPSSSTDSPTTSIYPKQRGP